MEIRQTTVGPMTTAGRTGVFERNLPARPNGTVGKDRGIPLGADAVVASATGENP
jgi:hypothetical protein